MFQLFCYKQSKFTVVKLLRLESKSSLPYEDTIIEHGAHNTVVTDRSTMEVKNGSTNDIVSFFFPGFHHYDIMTTQYIFLGTK